MPCKDYEGMSEVTRAVENARTQSQKEYDMFIEPLEKKVDTLTDMLCWILTRNRFNNLREDIQVWWTQHQKDDEKIKKEKRLKALAKLTDEDKELLGVK